MALEDRRDHLRLLALVARGQGMQGASLDQYEPPSQAMARDLWEPAPGPVTAATRELEVTQFLAQTGG